MPVRGRERLKNRRGALGIARLDTLIADLWPETTVLLIQLHCLGWLWRTGRLATERLALAPIADDRPFDIAEVKTRHDPSSPAVWKHES